MTRMARVFTALLPSFLLSAVVAPGLAAERPSHFAAYVKANPNAPIVEKLLGKLTASGGMEATFTALLAGDSSHPALQVRAVRVEVTDGQEKASVYLDEEIICRDTELGILPDDSLKMVLEDLSRLVDDKASIFAKMNGPAPSTDAPGGWAKTIGAYNAPEDALRTGRELPVPGMTVFNVGWEKKGQQQGVVLQITHANRDYFFPGADLSAVRDMIASAREFFGVSGGRKSSEPCAQR